MYDQRQHRYLITAYKTKPLASELIDSLKPAFEADKRLSDPLKIAADLKAKEDAYLTEAARQPYTSTFDEVFLVDPVGVQKPLWLKYRIPGGPKPPVCVAVREWLLSHYPGSWLEDWQTGVAKSGVGVVPVRVIFVGFNPKLFLKLLGEECSLPEINQPLPPRMWYGTSDHRDVEEAICPEICKRLTLEMALKRRRPAAEEAAQKWDAVLKDWKGPGHDVQKDALLVTQLWFQLGFFSDK
jgi:hypothetical protein